MIKRFFVLFILFNQYIVDVNNPETLFIYKIICCSIIISLGSGIFLDYYNLIDEEFRNIMKKDYVQFAKDSGFNTFRFAFKELAFNLISISISRLPLIFGGLVIIEYEMRHDNLSGISTLIFSSLNNANDQSVFCSVFVCIVFFMTIYFLTEKIKEILIQK